MCPTCGKNPPIMHKVYGVTACKSCLDKVSEIPKDLRRRPMTDYERKKLGWYRSEKKWVEDIRNRKAYGNAARKIGNIEK